MQKPVLEPPQAGQRQGEETEMTPGRALLLPRQIPVPSDDLLSEQAYTVARGVRALAILGQCESTPETMLAVATRIELLAAPGAIPFVCDAKNGMAEYGYAAETWVVDLLEWLLHSDTNVVPDAYRHHVVGLLLGYAPSAIRDFASRTAGRRFT